ncbi:diaminopimelate epimerase [Crassaminicella thermophila]|uniref:Diaminopimelate epimerase n=1 Tax=Crassaminicella thermophila TaxID=2599308 RepID=A0A5C0SHD1_CRATE|nr:diaminopimelate epimerase [Crassaminicella thermophila]QEK13087.1 diaminopimelate epimerase [Crassaminicella thermophila]
MKLNFIKTNPTENMTVFVVDQIPRSKYIEVAQKIMNYNSIHAEQVGFIEKSSDVNNNACVRLHMMGGEFCGNATRALAATLAYKDHCTIDKLKDKMIIPLEVSGADEIIYCEVEATNDNTRFISSATMPLHKGVESCKIEYNENIYEGTLVHFSGIIHFIVNSRRIESKEAFFLKVKEKLNDLEYDALGIMFYNEEDIYIEPLVYVRETESLVWERGCGSGTAALGVALSHQFKKSVDVVVKQPGGELKIITKWNGNDVEYINLKGIVEIVAEGIVHI